MPGVCYSALRRLPRRDLHPLEMNSVKRTLLCPLRHDAPWPDSTSTMFDPVLGQNAKVGVRTTGADEMWHIDATVIRLLDWTKAYVHAVNDNFSRRILASRVADTFAPVNSVACAARASRGATRSASAPVVLADAGVENVNAQVDETIATGVLRRVLAFTELRFSNSMIEAWWRSLKHQWLFLHSLDTSRRSGD